MNNDSDKPPSQAFRNPSTLKVANIPTVIDPKTGRPIILWRDIQAAFEKAKAVWNGESLVPLMIDENLEQVIPLRIAYHPGVVFDVVADTTEQIICTGEDVHPSQFSSAGKESKEHDNQLNQTAAALHISDNATNHTTSNQTTIMHSLNQNLELLEDEMTKHKELQQQIVQILELQQHTSQELLKVQVLQQHTSQEFHMMQESQQTGQELLRKQEEMRQMQQRALDRLANIQTSVQAVLTQTYELHEYPIPRLFIVLPKAVGLREKFKSPLSEQFRLYFLCECGTHTMVEDSRTPHEVHLAKHEGYDLEQPTKFFERYGPYVLTLMNMVKYGIVAAGLVVPSLASLKIVEGLDGAQKHLEYLKKNIVSLVDDTINFLQDIKSNNEAGSELITGSSEFDQLEALEGADLRQLESYLRIKDQGRVLGNLYRIITPEGHVKWVCFDHYRVSYRESSKRQLRDIVEVNNGRFIEEKGRIEIKISSSVLARQFYDAMIKSGSIQELDITLEWDATMGDLRILSKAITKAN
ncbi:hypothetical protein BGZ65_003025, partial [Modicella reniformis]